MQVAELWRFPVKSLRGERLQAAELTVDGVAGDRIVHVRRGNGVLTERTRHRLLSLTGSTSPQGEVLIDGRRWDHPSSVAAVRAAADPDAELAHYAGRERFDVLPLLVATDGAIAAFGYDGRRLRPNIVISGVPGLAERSWPGRALRIGDALIGIESLRARCVTTNIDPDTGQLDLDVLRTIRRQFDGKIALNCWVAAGGVIAVADPVEVVDVALSPPQRGGWILGAPYDV